MAIGDPYVELDIVKARLNITTDPYDDALEGSIAAASKAIEDYCGQHFNQSATATEKVFTVSFPDVLEIPNLVTVSEIATDDGNRTYESVWAATDYDLYPYDAEDNSVPYTEIRRSPLGNYSFPSSVKGIRVTAIWGWPAVPPTITEAAALTASRLWKRTESPLGLSSRGEFEFEIPKIDPDVRGLLAPYRVFVI